MTDSNAKFATCELLDLPEVAGMLGVSRATVYRLARSRALPHYRIRGIIRFRQADVETLLADHRVEALDQHV